MHRWPLGLLCSTRSTPVIPLLLFHFCHLSPALRCSFDSVILQSHYETLSPLSWISMPSWMLCWYVVVIIVVIVIVVVVVVPSSVTHLTSCIDDLVSYVNGLAWFFSIIRYASSFTYRGREKQKIQYQQQQQKQQQPQPPPPPPTVEE